MGCQQLHNISHKWKYKSSPAEMDFIQRCFCVCQWNQVDFDRSIWYQQWIVPFFLAQHKLTLVFIGSEHFLAKNLCVKILRLRPSTESQAVFHSNKGLWPSALIWAISVCTDDAWCGDWLSMRCSIAKVWINI